MDHSSSNPSVVVEVVEEYPYPSDVFVQNFVTIKLSDRDNYNMWKTQTKCLLVSHGMLGFVNGTFVGPEGNVSRKEVWERSDTLVKGWILGSLSEQVFKLVLDDLHPDFTAKNVWDELQRMYGPVVILRDRNVDERIRREVDFATSQGFFISKTVEDMAAKEIETIHLKLYRATLRGKWEDVNTLLETKKVTVTEKISNNGNTALHVAVGTSNAKKKGFTKKMLELAPSDDELLNLRNSDGSTLLHVAATVGDKDVVEILVSKNRALLDAKDHKDFTPLDRAYSNMHTDIYYYLFELKFEGPTNMHTDQILINVISSKDFELANKLVVPKPGSFNGEAVLMAMAQNYPSDFRDRETFVYEVIHADITDAALLLGMNERTICVAPLVQTIKTLFWIVVNSKVWPFRTLKERAKRKNDANDLLINLLRTVKHSKDISSLHYTNPILEAARINAYEVIESIVYYFPNAIWSANEDGHNIIQLAVISRSEDVYNLLYQMSEHKNIYRTIKDSYGNNLLHLAGRLAPSEKLNLISGAALQIQSELRWFKEVEEFVCPLNIMQKNSFGETPQRVFTMEHKELVIEGEKWMKDTAESYTITAALITTIVFAAAITVPGGNKGDNGIPVFSNNVAFTIFAVSDAISLFTSTTSLLMFLSILTARFAEQDFLLELPRKLIIGLATLFISTTAMLVAFGATLFLVFGQQKSWTLGLIAALTCLPIGSFMRLQLPLLVDLMRATYDRKLFGKKRNRPFY